MTSSDTNSVQDRIKKNGSLYGNKASNLIELDALAKTLYWKYDNNSNSRNFSS